MNRSSVVYCFAFAALAALALTHDAQADLGPTAGGVPIGVADARYCQTDGCTMTGDLDMPAGGGSEPTLTFDASTSGLSGSVSSLNLIVGGTRRLLLGTGGALPQAGGNYTLGSAASPWGDAFFAGEVSNPNATNNGRLYIDDDAEVTGTLYTANVETPSTLLRLRGTSLRFYIGGADRAVLGTGGLTPIADGGWAFGSASAHMGNSFFQTITRDSGDLTLSTTTSGDVVLSPVSGIVDADGAVVRDEGGWGVITCADTVTVTADAGAPVRLEGCTTPVAASGGDVEATNSSFQGALVLQPGAYRAEVRCQVTAHTAGGANKPVYTFITDGTNTYYPHGTSGTFNCGAVSTDALPEKDVCAAFVQISTETSIYAAVASNTAGDVTATCDLDAIRVGNAP